MICPSCRQRMREIASFLTVERVCEYCAGIKKAPKLTGYVILDYAMSASLAKQPLRLMVFRDLPVAISALHRMSAHSFVSEVKLDVAPEWVPRLGKPQDSVAWIELRWDDVDGCLRGGK